MAPSPPAAKHTTHLPAVVGALLVLLGAAVPARAQQVTIFSDDFQAYSVGNLPTGGNWVYGQNGKTTVELNAGGGKFLYIEGGGGISAVTKALNTSAGGGTLTFDLRYTGDNGAAPADDNTVTDGKTFNELDNASDVFDVLYTTTWSGTIGGSTWTSLGGSFAFNNTTYRNGFVAVSLSVPTLSTLYLRFTQANGGGANQDQIGFDNVLVTTNAAVVPEPGTWALFGTAAAGLGALVVRRRRRAAAART